MNKTKEIELRKNVLDELEWDPSIDARPIGVSVKDGVIELNGHVRTYAEKVSAERIAKRVHGVTAVANEIEVRLAAAGERDDVDIARSAANALDWNVAIPKERIKVSVSKGWVTLDGKVEWQYQRRAADEAVRVLPGVRGITNKIEVAALRPQVRDIKNKIEAALKRNAEIDAAKITVQSSEGKVVLTGNVRSWAERDDAVNAAWSAPGVTSVVDQIRIQG